MKYIIRSLVITLVLVVSTTVARSQDQRHIGRWEASAGHEIGALQFDKDGSLRFFKDGREMKEQMQEELGDTVEVRYEIDYSHDPIWLDIVIVNITGEEIMRGKAIVRFTGEDEMEMKVGNKPEERPEQFGEERKTETIRFRRVEEFNFDGFK